jgi:hypothetical protein
LSRSTSATVSPCCADEIGGLVHGDDAAARRFGRRSRRVTPSPLKCTTPSSAGSTPDRIFTSVDLPAPLAPMRATISPRSIDSDAPESARVEAKAAGEIFYFKQGHSRMTDGDDECDDIEGASKLVRPQGI